MRLRLLLLTAPAVLLAGCGGTETVTKTVTATQTKTETVTTEAATPPPTDTTSTEIDAAADPPPPAEPLPDGVVGLDGTYLLTEADANCSGRNFNCTPIAENRYEETEDAQERRARATTTCSSSGDCTVRFGLGLNSGGEKIYELEADPDREGTYVGTATGQADCGSGGATRPTKERVSARAASTTDATGRVVADRLDVFLTIRVTCTNILRENVKSSFTFRGALRK